MCRTESFLCPYNTVEYSGFLSILGQSECIEMIISIYHFGDIWYETDG